ncbi:MAG: tRNA (N6-isopentenyl adenosine(37)-C2)-methylthiotransferase MiaB [Aggregatilineales bacterium]|nr:tRNA (N6-isopentenyl adenosine(37)-C2)-methylthiotransferase MiaB [Chloroflexota bacterium]HOA22700.1 tRNA (N6-isopentenyl adenosine(37)-C2)-methylthiotransferase MiaB [Aggregatilineales bacterium]HPV06607.1 tRNA (N6-isopentenyl adenosine(37)-C2)-methylthiotransferase MiaB [Aggregatilineales bacterium]HQE18604.1 tRNA (N6-isopentenyl adenosine(37)-C2)-methylthiotransferase MiaB [Aggregatilineales bacterium]
MQSLPKTYNIRTWGCQMNEADSQRLASELERFGLVYTDDSDAADVIVLNTCVVRQSAEDRVYGRLGQLKVLKEANPNKIIGLMGCLVGVRDPLPLRRRFPFVDVFLPPSEPGPMVEFLKNRGLEQEVVELQADELALRYAIQDGDVIIPQHERGQLVSAYIPVVYGCSHACSFCIIPFRRGVERSRRVGEIAQEARSLAAQGVVEITLLGQIVDRYGMDIPDGPDLADLLRVVHEIDGIQRIRFLTSHPNWMTDKLLDTVAELPKVMPHIEVPIQAGDDEVLRRMKRGYTQQQYRDLVAKIRDRIPDVAIHTDIIVGFPGETEEQFMETYRVLEDLKLDKAHLAMYSPRPKTVSARTMEDDVPPEEKKRRLHLLDELQSQVMSEINARYLGQTVEVLVEDEHKGKWRGRTPQNKLVFFEADGDWRGKLVDVEITWTGPYSMQGRLPGSQPKALDSELIVISAD